MSPYLTQYQLTDKCNGLTRIVLPQNGQGDPHHDFPINKITDENAAALLLRKDGRGAQYVQLISKKK